MKKFTIFIALVLLSTFGFAQAGQTPSAKVKQQMEVLRKADLNLSEVQLGRIQTVLMGEEANAARMLKALEGNKSLQEKRLQEMKQNQINNVKGAMSPQQAEKFDALNLGDKL
jgi:hypothetical protein